MDLEQLYTEAEDALKSHCRKLLPKARSAQRSFFMNVCIVALGIRAGYLIDEFSPTDGVSGLHEVLLQLRKVSGVFEIVKIVYAKTSDQYFLLNMEQTLSNLGSKEIHQVQCVHGEQKTATTGDIPDIVKQSLQVITNTGSSDEIILSEDVPPEYLVCLAGLLLEYSVPYFPGSTGSLDGVQLDLYNCSIKREGSKSRASDYHVLVQFSIPNEVSRMPGLQPDVVQSALKEKFGARIGKYAPSWRVEVSHTVVTKDKIAF